MKPEKSPAQCDGCFHAKVENSDQTGCDIDVLKTLKPYKKEGDSFFKLDKICLFKNKSESEVDIKLGYLFILNKDSQLETLKNNISAISSKNPAWVGVIIQTVELNKEIKECLDKIGCRYNIITNFKEVDNVYKMDQFIDLFHNGWTLVNVVGEEFIDIKNKLTNFVLQGGVAAVIKSTNNPEDIEVNGVAYYNYIYKMLNGNLPELIDEEKMYVTKSFAQKVFERSPGMIMKWEDL